MNDWCDIVYIYFIFVDLDFIIVWNSDDNGYVINLFCCLSFGLFYINIGFFDEYGGYDEEN